MVVLAIDTSCDETSAAVLDGQRVLSSVVWSQLELHRKWGGVVPHLARRAHEERLPVAVNAALSRAEVCDKTLSAIAVTIGPGLAPALEVGIAFAKQFAVQNSLPLIPVNHLEGHIASIFLQRKTGAPFVDRLSFLPSDRFLSLIVSGGHTELVMSEMLNDEFRRHSLFGQTLDDAAGECLDKVGREFGLGYPAGPVIEQVARDGDPGVYKLPVPLLRSPQADLNFSFSGIKTAAVQRLYRTIDLPAASRLPAVHHLSKQDIADFSASVQLAVAEALILKLRRAMKLTGIATVLFVGGVAANNYLRRRIGGEVRHMGGRMYAAPKKFTGDNAAMIGLAAQWALARGEARSATGDIAAIDRIPNLNFPAAKNCSSALRAQNTSTSGSHRLP